MMAMATRSMPVRLTSVKRVQHRGLWRAYTRYRDEDLTGEDGPNEMLLFHGTGARSAAEVLAHSQGLDPRFGAGGFYGQVCDRVEQCPRISHATDLVTK